VSRARLVRDAIEAALADADVPLGIATFPDGHTTPALNVGDWQDGTTVTGLEVVIAPNPAQKSVPAFEFLGFQRSYPVRLINWGGSEDLEAAVNAIAAVFWPLAEDPRLLPASPDYPEQVTLSVTPE
jgi:hypothetical protein